MIFIYWIDFKKKLRKNQDRKKLGETVIVQNKIKN